MAKRYDSKEFLLNNTNLLDGKFVLLSIDDNNKITTVARTDNETDEMFKIILDKCMKNRNTSGIVHQLGDIHEDFVEEIVYEDDDEDETDDEVDNSSNNEIRIQGLSVNVIDQIVRSVIQNLSSK